MNAKLDHVSRTCRDEATPRQTTFHVSPMKANSRKPPVDSRKSCLFLLPGLALLLALQTASGQTLLLDGDFDSLPIGTAPNAYTPAGNWQFPSAYVSSGMAETDPSEFTIVHVAGAPIDAHALQLQGTAGMAADHHLPNVFTEPITRASGKNIRVTFDIYSLTGHGGGSVYLGSEGYATRGPQLTWHSDGTLLATEGTSITSLTTYLDGWQTVRLEVRLDAQTYDVLLGVGSGHFHLLASGLQFRSDSVDFLDRFTIARFSFDPDVWSMFDNISVEAGIPPTIIQQPGTLYVSSDGTCTNLTVVADGTPPLEYQWYEVNWFTGQTNDTPWRDFPRSGGVLGELRPVSGQGFK